MYTISTVVLFFSVADAISISLAFIPIFVFSCASEFVTMFLALIKWGVFQAWLDVPQQAGLTDIDMWIDIAKALISAVSLALQLTYMILAIVSNGEL